MKTEKILLIGREATPRGIMLALLNHMGYQQVYEVMTCSNGIKEVRTGEYTLVITEAETGEDANGFDVIKAVRQLGGNTKAILVLDKETAASEDRGFADQPDAVLGKPFENEEFQKVVGLTLRQL